MLSAPDKVNLGEVELALYCAGSGDPIILLHGFPATSVSLHNQFRHLADRGFECIAIDQRGFGLSSCPDAVEAYRMELLVGDVIAVMDKLGIEQAWLLGHDWGGSVAWQTAMRHPARVKGVMALTTPHFPRSPVEPIAARRAAMGPDNYVVRFQEPGTAEAILDRDIARTIDFMFRKNFMTLAAFPEAAPVVRRLELLNELQAPSWPGEPLLDKPERSALISAFRRTGFGPGVNWYRNVTRNWQDTEGLAHQIDRPAIMISGADDYFSPPATVEITRQQVPNFDAVTVPGGHWIPLESPAEVNSALVRWLSRVG